MVMLYLHMVTGMWSISCCSGILGTYGGHRVRWAQPTKAV